MRSEQTKTFKATGHSPLNAHRSQNTTEFRLNIFEFHINIYIFGLRKYAVFVQEFRSRGMLPASSFGNVAAAAAAAKRLCDL